MTRASTRAEALLRFTSGHVYIAIRYRMVDESSSGGSVQQQVLVGVAAHVC
jgi:hypothetical protein